MNDQQATDNVLAANETFYAAFRKQDYAAMEQLWSETKDIAVTHPGWPALTGWDNVMESWYRILRVGTPPDIHAHEPHVLLHGKTAMVTCTEDLGDARMIATNTFTLEGNAWLLVNHQAEHLPDQLH